MLKWHGRYWSRVLISQLGVESLLSMGESQKGFLVILSIGQLFFANTNSTFSRIRKWKDCCGGPLMVATPIFDACDKNLHTKCNYPILRPPSSGIWDPTCGFLCNNKVMRHIMNVLDIRNSCRIGIYPRVHHSKYVQYRTKSLSGVVGKFSKTQSIYRLKTRIIWLVLWTDVR